MFNPFKPEFTVVIFIHYKPRIAAAILGLEWMKMTWCGLKLKENCQVLVNQFHGNFRYTPLVVRKLDMFSVMYNDALMHHEGLKG